MITNRLTISCKFYLFIILFFLTSNSSGQIELSDKYLNSYNDFFPHHIFSHFTHNDTLVFIYPDATGDSILTNELSAFVKQFSNPNIILKGKEAIGSKFIKSNELIVFGDSTINDWCNAFIDELPINKDIFKGKSTITTWFNPVNPHKGCLIFSFSKEKHLPSLNGIDFGKQLAVKEDTSIIFEGYYNLTDNSLILSEKKDDKINKLEKFTKVQDINLYLVPSCDNLYQKKGKINSVEKITDNDINKKFNNTKDLYWLMPIAKDNEIICLGENHYFKSNINIRNKIFFFLNSNESFPYILLEEPYSKTSIIEHFLTLSGNDSALFYKHYLSKVVHSQEEFELIKHIKQWNKTHKLKPLKIGYTDIEHQYTETVNNILLPVLFEQTKDSLFSSNAQINDLQQLDSFILNAEKAINKDQADQIGFLRKEDFKIILRNLKATSLSYNALNALGFKDFNKVRNKKYIENVLLFRRNNNTNQLNKLCIFGGSNHFVKNTEDSLNIYYYLNRINPDTKDKVYSIRLLSLSYSFDNLNLHSKSLNNMGRGYKKLIEQAKKYNKVYNSDSNRFSIFPDIISILKEMMLLGCVFNDSPFIFDPIYWNGQLREYENRGRSDYLSSHGIYFGLCSYDKSIIIPHSLLINAID